MPSPPALSSPGRPGAAPSPRDRRRDAEAPAGLPGLPGRLAALREAAGPYAVAATRCVFGLLFFCHGSAGFFDLPKMPVNGGTTELTAWPAGPAAVIQIVGGALLMLGLGTRTAALVCSGSMAYAYFDVHQPTALWPIQNGGEDAAVFCWAFLLLAFTGPGALSVDGLLRRRGIAGPDRKTSRAAPYPR
ncbi:DoxX family protein [Streptomyces buecherae]|uniref:DoxX family protein n=1 Tax=Streptomyces buecherae TaxID=2763006 RepID=UPI001C25350D|nr:DoxX family protein [Streptomyces buecherae]